MRTLAGEPRRPSQLVLSESTHHSLPPQKSTSSAEERTSTAAAWRTKVEKELGGADFQRSLVRSTVGGLKLQPVYARCRSEHHESVFEGCTEDSLASYPGQAPFIRGGKAPQGSRSWRITVQCDLADADAKRKLMEDLQGGADGIQLIAADMNSIARLSETLADVIPDACSWILSGGSVHAELTSAFLTWLKDKAQDFDSCDVNLSFDPIAEAARSGEHPQDWAPRFALGFQAFGNPLPTSKQSRIFCVDTLPYHMAGASEGQELALALAGVVEILRRAEDAKLDLAEVAARISMRFAIARDTFVELAKLRAARGLCQQVLAACDLIDIPALPIHAVTSARTLARRDPWVNMLRSSTQCFAAILGGADAITTLPFDSEPGPASDLGRRVARNTQIILDEEAHLGDVADPAGGAYALENYTRELAELAWAEFQEIEKQGGLASTLQSGWVAKRLKKTHEARTARLQTRRLAMTGVSEYANLDEVLPASMMGAAQRASDSSGSPSSLKELPVHHDSDDFEQLRDRADAWAAQHGSAPTVFLHTLGKAAQFGARLDFARNFFAAGGWRITEGNSADEFVNSGGIAACICGPDSIYSEQAGAASESLTQAGAKRILIAGKLAELPSSIHGGIHLGCNAWQILSDLHDLHEEVQA